VGAGEYYDNASGSVFGGGSDPEDSGVNAWGERTGEGGVEGVAVPMKVLQRTFPGVGKNSLRRRGRVLVRTPDGREHRLPLADLGTAERVWAREGRPVLDFTPGAAERVGGVVHRSEDGRMTGVSGLDNLSFSLYFQQEP
jgi:hypothetical protein